MDKNFIQKAVPKSHVGMFHKAVHVPEGKPIPMAKIEKAENSKNPHMRHMAQFAENMHHIPHPGAMHMKAIANARAMKGR
jgi:hypothetical protein